MQKRLSPLILRRHVLGSVLVVLAMGLLGVVLGQTNTVGTISGTVRDQNGGAIAKAEVVLTEERTGLSRTVKTDDAGLYTAASLPVGIYSVSTAPSGFKTSVNNGLELHVNENLVVNLTVQVGQMSETVTVTGEAAQVETRSGEVSSLVGEKQVTELPLNGRNYAALVTMIPGFSPTNDGSFATRGTGLDSHVDISVNGNQSNANLWTVDGVNNMDVGSNATLLVFPSIDTIQEFRVERNSFSAEFGQAQGAVINLVTKGGTNQFHGGVFEFLRNDALNATDFFLNEAGQPKGKLRYNNFGGNFGGPILKDRVFFLWSEEWRRERRGIALSGHVPTAQEKVGDFSGPIHTTLDANGKPVIPVNPYNNNQPFPGNKIPANLLSPAGLALVKEYPDPNNLADPTGLNWVGAPLQPINTRQDSIRGDINLTKNMNVMVRWINETWTHGAASGNFWGDSPFPTLSSDWDQPSNSFAVKVVNTLSATMVNEFQFSRAGNDIIITTSPATQALDDEITSKFPTVFPRPAGTGAPSLEWGAGGYNTLWHQAPWHNHEDLFIWKDDFSKVAGPHTLKFGALFSHNIKNEQPNGNSGLFNIQNSGTRTNNAIAEILLKDLPIVDYSEVDHQETTQGRWHDFEVYANDTWKMRSNLTVTMGLRYAINSPAYSANNRITNFFPNLFNGKDINTGFVTAGTPGFPDALVDTYHGGIQPRLGIAWDIFGDGKTALRVGGGRYTSRSNVIASLLRMATNPPWTKTVDTGWQGSVVNLADCPTCRSLDTINPGLKSAAVGVTQATTLFFVDPHFRQPESWQWNVSISREVMKNTIVEASYIGNHGLHLWRLLNGDFNDVTPAGRAAVAAAGPNPPGALVQANLRYPGLGPITKDESTGDSSYQALQIWINRRFTDRLAFQAAYTWSHTITDVPTQSFISATTDVFNYARDKGDADLDRRHMFVFNTVYALPSFQKLGLLPSKILGDWQVNTIASFLGGTPIDVISGMNTAGLRAAGSQRPNLVPGQPIFLHTGDATAILNPKAFAIPAQGQFGDLGRGAIHGPGTTNVDFSVAKNWRVKERYGLQFRAEMFNVFNNVNFRSCDLTNAGGCIDNTLTDGNFGKATATKGPREIQFGLKFNF